MSLLSLTVSILLWFDPGRTPLSKWFKPALVSGSVELVCCVQKAEESQRQTFIEVIHWSLHSVRSSTYGKNFLIKLVVSSETSSYFDADHLGVTGVRPASFVQHCDLISDACHFLQLLQAFKPKCYFSSKTR